MPLQGEVVQEYLRKFPNTGSLTLARIVYNDNKELFNTVETARNRIRYYRGAHGNGNRQSITNKDFFRPLGTGADTFPSLPEGFTSIDEWEIFKITGDHKVLILGDIHIPYHSREAVEVAIKKGKESNPDIILLNGDIFDFFTISRWEKDPRKRNFKLEIEMCKQFLEYLRYNFPNAEIIFKQGNHEERYENYMFIKAPELVGIENFTFANILDFEKFGILEISEMKPIKLNECFIIHGHEYKFSISNPVNPARGLYLRSKVNCITNHFHQSSAHSEKDIEDKVTSCWSLGHLSEPHPKYMPLNKWNHGFATVETFGDKLFNVNSYKIIDNQIYSE
jgi:predicted phosphodiesterase